MVKKVKPTATARAAGSQAEDIVFGRDKPTETAGWKRTICAFAATLLAGAGLAISFGWMTEMLIVGALWLTGSAFAALAIYWLGMIAMVVAAFITLPKVWDGVMTGRTEEMLASGWARITGIFRRSEEDDTPEEDVPVVAQPRRRNGAAVAH